MVIQRGGVSLQVVGERVRGLKGRGRRQSGEDLIEGGQETNSHLRSVVTENR